MCALSVRRPSPPRRSHVVRPDDKPNPNTSLRSKRPPTEKQQVAGTDDLDHAITGRGHASVSVPHLGRHGPGDTASVHSCPGSQPELKPRLQRPCVASRPELPGELLEENADRPSLTARACPPGGSRLVCHFFSCKVTGHPRRMSFS